MDFRFDLSFNEDKGQLVDIRIEPVGILGLRLFSWRSIDASAKSFHDRRTGRQCDCPGGLNRLVNRSLKPRCKLDLEASDITF